MLAIEQNFRRAFIGNAAAMFKAWAGEQLKAAILGDALHQKSAITRKAAEAKIGAVRAYQAFAGIPLVGPALGAAAAAAAFAFLIAFHSGGYVGRMMQPQQGNERIVKVEVGEYVMQRRAVDRIGQGTLDYMNRTGQVPNAGGFGSPRFEFHIHGVEGGSLSNLRRDIEDTVVPILEDLMQGGRFRGNLKGAKT
jgi:hypothetical protein